MKCSKNSTDIVALKSKFQVGDRVIWSYGEHRSEKGTVVRHYESGWGEIGLQVLFDGKDTPDWDTYDCFELDPISRSPLWEALK